MHLWKNCRIFLTSLLRQLPILYHKRGKVSSAWLLINNETLVSRSHFLYIKPASMKARLFNGRKVSTFLMQYVHHSSPHIFHNLTTNTFKRMSRYCSFDCTYIQPWLYLSCRHVCEAPSNSCANQFIDFHLVCDSYCNCWLLWMLFPWNLNFLSLISAKTL